MTKYCVRFMINGTMVVKKFDTSVARAAFAVAMIAYSDNMEQWTEESNGG